MNPKVQDALNNVPENQREKWHGYCGEVSCANQTFNDKVTPPFLIELMGRKSKSLLLFKNRWTTIY